MMSRGSMNFLFSHTMKSPNDKDSALSTLWNWGKGQQYYERADQIVTDENLHKVESRFAGLQFIK